MGTACVCSTLGDDLARRCRRLQGGVVVFREGDGPPPAWGAGECYRGAGFAYVQGAAKQVARVVDRGRFANRLHMRRWTV